MSIKSPLNRQFGTQFDSVFDVVKSNPMYDKTGGKIPSLDLNFAKSKSLRDSRSTKNLINFTRASSGTYVGSDGLIKTSPVNYAINSEQVDLWSLSNGSVSANFAESPIGDLTADKWIPDTAIGYHYPKLTTTLSSTSSITYSIYAKQAGYRYLLINTPRGSTSGNAGPIVDLQDGVVAGNYAATNPTTVADAGNGWWRVAMTFTGNGTDAINVDHNPFPTSTVAQYAGDGTSGVLLWGSQLEEGTTATTYIPTTTTISGAPRFDHDPVTGESLGLLIEEARTNELTFSSTLDGYETPGITSKTQNAGIAPDGTNTAVLAETITTGNDSHLREITSQVVNTTYTYSFFAKPGTVDYAVVYNIAKNGVGLTWFNVANGTIGTTASGVTPFIKPAGNGWYRVGVTLTTDSTITNNLVDIRWGPADGVFSQTAGENAYVWGAQLESGSFPTSIIPTSGSTVTRAADVASITGTNFSSWFNPSEGTMFAEAKSVDGVNGVFSVGSTTGPIGGLNYDYNGFNGQWQGGVMDGTFNPVDGSFHKFALTATTTSNTLFTDGNQQDTAVATSSNVGVNLIVGNRSLYGGSMSSTHYLNGHIKRLAYFNTRLSDDKLKSITS